ncbi:MAG: peptide chain release factor 2 [Patescibacteria group bacterium]|mgnify:CR=1 FL=1
MQELKTRLQELVSIFEKIKVNLDPGIKKQKIIELEAKTMDPDFWSDQNRARSVMQEIGDLRKEVETLEILEKDVSAVVDLATDPDLEVEVLKEIERIEKGVESLKLKTYLSGEYDMRPAVISIHAGQGGTEAMDWASMLFRMYTRYCERHEWPLSVIEETPGEEAGIKSITFKVAGQYAYGFLKKESGTHRLVRQSPFNADSLRQTSFAMVEVLPELEEKDSPDIELEEEDLEIQFYRSGGHGGQNVNKVSTAVRLKHVPTGVVVTAQTERFQEQNRKNAMNLLRAKLWILEKEKALKEKKDLKGEYVSASWGTQIRSYVLHPYKMVKDLRTNFETGNAEAVLDGEIDGFIEAELKLGHEN